MLWASKSQLKVSVTVLYGHHNFRECIRNETETSRISLVTGLSTRIFIQITRVALLINKILASSFLKYFIRSCKMYTLASYDVRVTVYRPETNAI